MNVDLLLPTLNKNIFPLRLIAHSEVRKKERKKKERKKERKKILT